MLTAREMIVLADESELNDIIQTVIWKYSKVNPDWEMGVYVIQRSKDRAQQIDQPIAFLDATKNLPSPPQIKGG